MSQKEEIVQRIPLWWAVAITVCIVLPLAFFLGKWNFPLWVAWIAWAEYFAFGAQPGPAFKIWGPGWPFGAVIGFLWLATTVALTPAIGVFWGCMIGNVIWVTVGVYGMVKWKMTGLAVFGGLTMFLAVYFTNSIPEIGPLANPYWVTLWCCIWTIIMGFFGMLFGWLNITLTFPHKVTK